MEEEIVTDKAIPLAPETKKNENETPITTVVETSVSDSLQSTISVDNCPQTAICESSWQLLRRFSLKHLGERTFHYSYYLSAYLLICYYAWEVIKVYQGNNDVHVIVESSDYTMLTSVAVGFLGSDMVVKYYTSPKNKLYYALQLHHIIGIVGYLVSYHYQKGHLLVSNLSLFELSSIPLLFYSNRVLVPISLPVTWISYLFVRVIWGNILLLSGLTQINLIEEDVMPGSVIFFLNLMHAFFLFANNYWFYLLTCQLKRKSISWRENLKSKYRSFKSWCWSLIGEDIEAFEVYNVLM